MCANGSIESFDVPSEILKVSTWKEEGIKKIYSAKIDTGRSRDQTQLTIKYFFHSSLFFAILLFDEKNIYIRPFFRVHIVLGNKFYSHWCVSSIRWHCSPWIELESENLINFNTFCEKKICTKQKTIPMQTIELMIVWPYWFMWIIYQKWNRHKNRLLNKNNEKNIAKKVRNIEHRSTNRRGCFHLF